MLVPGVLKTRMAVNGGDNRSSRIIGFVDFGKHVKNWCS